MKYASEDDYLKMDDETKAYYHKVAKTVGYTVFNLDQTTIQAENPKLYKKMLDRFSKLTGERDNVQKTAIAVNIRRFVRSSRTLSVRLTGRRTQLSSRCPTKRISDRMCLSIVHWYMR